MRESMNLLLVQRRQLERSIDRIECRRLRAVGDEERLENLYSELEYVEGKIRERDLCALAA